ncbi:hypothetical protein OIE69_44130 (plasmid) [Actinacidiphila glaucinigra]|uniref:hypothetical protein n=1 Tax=Actinacidiphila glaucinigra TaxID=235986 RepID=UPI002DDA4507|nr:hypothetical protein [Actinacidiphila glaucinigra]WSD65894.1 hypothetical protein OIE69_44130 [Actinacidiphila glaucinigra]
MDAMRLDVSGMGDLQAARSQRIAGHLASIASERSRVLAGIEELQTHLAELDRESAVLTRLQNDEESVASTVAHASTVVSEGPSPSEEPASGTDEAAVPRPRGRKSAAAKPARSRKASGGRQRPAVGARSAKKESGPSLVALVQQVLHATHEPRMVREVAEAVAEQHPDRAASSPVIRNTLENLVAKGLAERERRQGSVFYTAIPAADAGRDRGTDAEPQSDGEAASTEA